MRATHMREFVAPLPLIAVALLALNDHVLKAAYGNWITGKLSDVAICFFLPLLVSALLGLVSPVSARTRLLVGCLVGAASFTALEMWTPLGAWFCRVMPHISGPLGAGAGCRLTEDATDLLCLILVPAAHAYGRHRLRAMQPLGRRSHVAHA